MLPVDVEDPSFLLTTVLGKVKETVPWPFRIGRLCNGSSTCKAPEGGKERPWYTNKENTITTTSIYVLRICGRGAGQETSNNPGRR